TGGSVRCAPGATGRRARVRAATRIACMSGPPSGPRAATAQELKDQIEAERTGRPFLAYRDEAGEQQLVIVEEGLREVWVGRSESADLRLDWDEQVSALHAQIEV